jgi:hypothetical protein
MYMKNDGNAGEGKVREPVQVYLDPEDRDRLERLRDRLGSTKSAILRRGLEALEREVLDPAAHPALGLIGMVEGGTVGNVEPDPARSHDTLLSDDEEASWSGGGAGGDSR